MHIKYFPAVIIFPKAINKSISNVGLQSCIFKSLFLMRKLLYRLEVGPDRKMFATITTNCHSYRHHHHHHQNFVFTRFTVFIINVPNFGIPNEIRKYTTTAI